jgi:hypothetical protein
MTSEVLRAAKPMLSAPHGSEEQWTRRLERERRARRQAEQVAEEGMRALWLANQTLEHAVRSRTAAHDREVQALKLASFARLALHARLASELQRTGHPEPGLLQVCIEPPELPAFDSSEVALHALGDETVDRWQRPLARRGMLLETHADTTHDAAIDAPGETAPPRGPVALVVAAATLLLEATRETASRGVVHVVWSLTRESLCVRVSDAGPSVALNADDVSQPASLLARLGRRGLGLAAVHILAERLPVLLTHEPGAPGLDVGVAVPLDAR